MLKYWSQKEISLLKKYYPNLWVKDLAKMFPNRTRATITAKALSLGLSSAKLWQPKEIKILHKHFTESSIQELIKLLPNRSKSAILAKGERLKLKRNTKKPKIEVNEDYFKKWSPNMTYILGFILADGCIIKGTYKGYSDALKFGVQLKDIDVLKKIKQELDSKHRISIVKNAGHLAITSQKIVDDLKTLGIIYRKSLCEKIPSVPPKYLKEFIRGIIDGDGGLRLDKKNRPTLSLCGGKDTVIFVRDHFFKKLKLYSKITKNKKITSDNYWFSIAYRSNSAKAIIGYLYTDVEIYLERKFKIAEKISKINIPKKEYYSKREDEKIKKYYKKLTKEKLSSTLLNRSWPSIEQRARKLNIYKYKHVSNSSRKSHES